MGLRPVVFVPGTLVRTWGTRPISSNVVGVSNYVGQRFVTRKTVGVCKQTYGFESMLAEPCAVLP